MSKYEHYAKFVPKGVSIRDADDVKSVIFQNDSLDEDTIKDVARKEVIDSGRIDAYALRNHWELFDVEVQFYDEPWDNFTELVDEILHIDNVTSCEYDVDSKFYVGVKEGYATEVRKQIENYYSGLMPKKFDKRSLYFYGDARYM